MRRSLTLALVLSLTVAQAAFADVQRKKFTAPTAYLIVELLDDDLVHVELSAVGEGPASGERLYTSPMVLKTDYGGPSAFSDLGDTLETAQIRLKIDADNLCVRFEDKARGDAYLTTVCPADLAQPFKGINVDPASTSHVYGLGQQFTVPGSADGDWTSLGVREGQGDLGNGFAGFEGGAVGNLQIPVMYALGKANLNYALFLDNVYKQKWDFNAFWWQVRMFGDQVRYYFMAGPDLPDLRADYLELTGRPPVPPRKAFGLWVSEFGYDNWDQIDALKDGLRSEGFPVDGFVLDLNWFGGVKLNDPARSRMGRLDWDEDPDDGNPYFFPDPGGHIARYARENIGLTVIEESYLADSTETFSQMPTPLTAYARTGGVCASDRQSTPVSDVQGFWGAGRMIDWSDPAAGAWIHDHRRFPNLVRKGVVAHWTDLGEPESFRREACYDGVEITASGRKNEHSDIHNLYNLLWNKSIWDGYVAHQGEPDLEGRSNRRPFIVTRSGAAGTQRFGAAMWSGDIPSSLRALATHANAQLHMAFSGIDYYGADIGGFRREALPYNDKKGRYRGYEAELYTQWFANGAWFDVPVRPHTDNEFIAVQPPYQTAPDRVGKKLSNLANLRQRYELIPYYYSLAYRAYLFGEPLVAPPVFYYQNDPAVRRMGHEKLIGKDLLVGVVARHGEYERDVYLPAGTWVDYYSNEWIHSSGQTLSNVPVYRNGLLRLPAFARAGAILPQMHVDDNTQDAFGHHTDGAVRNELVVAVYAGPEPTRFTFYEDDGETLRYDPGGRPVYQYRTTDISQWPGPSATVTVTIDKAQDVNGRLPFAGASNVRTNVVRLVMENAAAAAVRLNGQQLTQRGSASAFAAASSGWFNAGANVILAKSGPLDVYGTVKTFSFELRAVPPTASVTFVCDRAFTSLGESIYVAGSIAALGRWDPAKAVKLDPNIYYDYVDGVNPPPNHNGPGPSAPVWSAVVAALPSDTSFEWKCLRRHEDVTGELTWEPGPNNTHRTHAAGYSGRSYGSF